MKKRFAAVAALVAAAFPARARAAGISLDVQSARGTGMAGAVSAMIDDASAIYYNPAGIAQGKIVDAQIGDSLIMPSIHFTDTRGATTNSSFGVVAPFQAYESGGVTDHLSIGVGVFTPYGLTLSWPSGWEGSRFAVHSSLQTFDFNPTVAYRIGPVRVGAGVQLVRATVDLQQTIRTGAAVASSELGAGTWGFGANVGVQVEAIPKYLSLAAHYRSAVKFDFDGEVHFGGVPLLFEDTLRDQRATTSILTPDTLQMGIASHPIDDVVVDLDVVWFGWSKLRSIDLHFPNEPTLDRSEAKSWNDSVNVHLGGEATIAEAWRVRAGVLYDPTPSPAETLAPDLPDTDRVNFALGGGYVHRSGFRVDVGYQLVVFLTKTSTYGPLPGDYGGLANIVGLSLEYRTPR